VDQPQELLLSELARAARLYPKIDEALLERAPTQITLSTAEAYEFLREIMPVLEESGFGVIAPTWWHQPTGQLAARLHIEAPPELEQTGESVSPATSVLGLNSLVNYKWQIAIGDQALTADEFRALTRENAPLVQVRGRWIEINREQLSDAQALLAKADQGQMTLLEAIHLAHGVNGQKTNLPISGMDATGWVADGRGSCRRCKVSKGIRRTGCCSWPRSFSRSFSPLRCCCASTR
jgi:non-specific serine/threonine protein kinase